MYVHVLLKPMNSKVTKAIKSTWLTPISVQPSNPQIHTHTQKKKTFLVGGWTNPFEKY